MNCKKNVLPLIVYLKLYYITALSIVYRLLHQRDQLLKDLHTFVI